MRVVGSLLSAWLLATAGWNQLEGGGGPMRGTLAFVSGPRNRCWRTAIRQSEQQHHHISSSRDRRARTSFLPSPLFFSPQPPNGEGRRPPPPPPPSPSSAVRPLHSVVEGRGERTKTASASRGGENDEQQQQQQQHTQQQQQHTTQLTLRGRSVRGLTNEDEEEEQSPQEVGQGVDGGKENSNDDDSSSSSSSSADGGPDLSAETKRLEELEQDIFKMAGREFKITSYVELSRVLFEDLKLPVVKQPTNKVLGGYYSTSNAVLNELSAMGYELPAKVLDYRALLYLIRSKQGKKKKKTTAESKAAAAEKEAAAVAGGKGERMSPEEKLMMSMLKEESGVDALDRTMVRVGVDISKVMERVQTMTTGGGLRSPGGATEGKEETFVPEEGGFEEPDLAEPIAMLQAAEEEDGDAEGASPPVSLFDKGWGVANNFVLVDAASIIFRTYHAMPKLTTPDGLPINAVLGFCNVLNKLLVPALAQSRVRPYVLVVFDGPAPLHRQTTLYPTYKANRASTPEDLIAQFPLAQEAAAAFGGINVTAPDGLEADDVIATFAQIAVEQVPDMKVTIVSSDKDFLQLVNDDISVFDPFNMARLGPNEVFEKYGLEPYQLLDYFAMVGDAADNVQGIPGIGPKTAQELLEEFESFEELWEFRDEVESPRLRKIVEENVEKFLMSRRLIRLKKLFEPPSMTLMPKARLAQHKVDDFCAKYGLKNLAERVKSTVARAEAAKEAAEEERGGGGGGGRGGPGFFS